MQLFLNNWVATTAAEASAAALEMVIAPTDAAKLIGLGAGDHYLLTLIEHDGTGAEIDWEIVKVIDADGITGALTIDPAGRGLDGTAARLWPIGTPISIRMTSSSADGLRARANHTGEQATSTVIGLDAALAARALIAGLPSRDVTASGAVTPADAGKWLICDSATPITLTIGAEATAAWTTSGILPMFHILQIGAGAVTVVGDGFSVMLHSDDTNVLDGPGAAATALWRATNVFNLFGRLVAA